MNKISVTTSFLTMPELKERLLAEGICNFEFITANHLRSSGTCVLKTPIKPSDELMNIINNRVAAPFYIRWEKLEVVKEKKRWFNRKKAM